MNNFFDLFDAEFEEPAKSAIQPSKSFMEEPEEETLDDLALIPPNTYDKFQEDNPDLFEEENKEPLSQRQKAVQDKHKQDSKPTDYTSMPQGLKEAQELNGVKDHGLKKKSVKGSLVAHHDDVYFEVSDKGVFTIADPNYLGPVILDLLHRKFAGKNYYGTTNQVLYKVPASPAQKKGPEPKTDDLLAPLLDKIANTEAPEIDWSGKTNLWTAGGQAPGVPDPTYLNDKYESYLNVTPGHISFDRWKSDVYDKENTPSEFIAALDKADNVLGFDIEPEEQDQPAGDLFTQTEFKPITPEAFDAIPVKNPPVDRPKFGRARFTKKPVDEGSEPDKRKIKANKKEQDGIQFDSTLELYMYNQLKENNIRFDMKVQYELQPGFEYRHESIKPMRVTPDYVLLDYPVIIDTKGFANERAPMQYKMLKYKFHLEGKEVNIQMPSNQKQCRKVIDGILNGFTVDEPLTEHAGKRRKNQLIKAGFTWNNGSWSRLGKTYDANYLMNLPVFEFTEILLSN